MIIYLDWSIDLADDHRASTGLIWGGNLLLIRCLKVARGYEAFAMSNRLSMSVICRYVCRSYRCSSELTLADGVLHVS